jgi:hypothetical protein
MPMQCLKHLVGKIKDFVGDFHIELLNPSRQIVFVVGKT